MDDIQKAILQTIDRLVSEQIKSVGCSYHKTGKIKSINGSLYTVTIKAEDYIYKARAGLTLTVGNVVYILVPNGNEENAFIDCIMP